MYRFLAVCILVLLLSGCEKDPEKLKIKERALTGTDINFLHPPLTPLNATLQGLKDGDMKMGERVLLAPMRYTRKLGNHRSELSFDITYQREQQIDIPVVKVLKTKKDKGASDGVLEPQRYNSVTLNTKMTYTGGKGYNFSLNHTNKQGGKEIRWIDNMLYVRFHGEQFGERKSIDNEHLLFQEEPVRLLKTFTDQLRGHWKLVYTGVRTVAGRSGAVFSIALTSEPFKKMGGDPRTVDGVEGELVVDQKELIPLSVTLKGDYRYQSKKHQKGVKVTFHYNRTVEAIGSEHVVKVPEKILNTMLAPEEQDAEEKILSFKPGHSMLEKLRAEDERHKKILEKSKEDAGKKDQKGDKSGKKGRKKGKKRGK